jgi:hypothetical protein
MFYLLSQILEKLHLHIIEKNTNMQGKLFNQWYIGPLMSFFRKMHVEKEAKMPFKTLFDK